MVSGRWLVRAIVGCLIAAGIALYLSVCLLFYQGQWQFVFSTHPQKAPNVAEIAKSSQLPIENVPFDYTEEGQARLDGWWIPAENSPIQDRSMVVLFFPNGRKTLPENIDALRGLHSLGVSVFAFDYRGTGESQAGHPSQEKSYRDGVAALRYLTGMKNIPLGRIVLYGAETGSAIAAHTAAQFPAIAGLILEDPQPSLTKQVKREQHIHLLPMWLVFTENFNIAGIIPRLKMPKLVIGTSEKPEYFMGAATIYDQAIAPKQKIRIAADASKSIYSQTIWQQTMQTFLNSLPNRSH